MDLEVGDIYLETADGNLCLGSLHVQNTAAGTDQAVTFQTAIAVNAATTLNFAIYTCDTSSAALVNYLDSSISVNSYQ